MSSIRVAPYNTRNTEKLQAPSKRLRSDTEDEMPDNSIANIQAALGPLLDNLKVELVSTQTLAINKLNEGLLQKIVELTETVNQSTARITKLENQLAQLRNSQQNKPIQPANKQTTNPSPLPTVGTQNAKPSTLGLIPWGTLFQNASGKQGNPASLPVKPAPTTPAPTTPVNHNTNLNSNTDGFTVVSHKKIKTTTTKLVQAKYSAIEREVILSFTNPTTAPPSEKSADLALEKVNKVIIDHNDINLPPFVRARFSHNNNLVFTTGLNNCGLEYDPYLNILVDAVRFLGPASARINEKWSKFLLHGVPTCSSLEAMRSDIETCYPALKLAQTPRWLSTAENRANKDASTIVISLRGNISLKQIGTTRLIIRNRSCTLADYVQFGPSTQCSKCQQYGHHTLHCSSKTAICAVCADEHPTKDHPCKILTCKAGLTCTHPPIKCAVCGEAHKSNDPKCPVRTTLSQEFRLQRSQPAHSDTNMEQEL